jgi:hypothetical protein
MMRLASLLLLPALCGLAACTDPQLGVGVTVGSGGVSVSPVVSGTVGGLDASLSVSN